MLSAVGTAWLDEAVLKVWVNGAAQMVLGMTLKTSDVAVAREAAERFPLCAWK